MGRRAEDYANESVVDFASEFSDADYETFVWEVIKPNSVELFFVPVFVVLLTVGLVGNSIVILIVLRDNRMKTVTNMFLLNLAFADFLFLLFCLPFTILWDITKTWWFGTIVCKLILYTQTVSVTVSVVTLTTISVERWYAICHPLRLKRSLMQTKLTLTFIWAVGLVLSLPELIVLEVKPWPFLRPNFSTIYLTQCTDTWSYEAQRVYQLMQTSVLYVIPFTLMAVLNGQLVYALWGSRNLLMEAAAQSMTASGATVDRRQLSHRADQFRRSIKLLIAIIALFGICYFPTHVMNVLRYFDAFPPLNPFAASVLKLLIRFFCYFNSCLNPIVYNFMSRKFDQKSCIFEYTHKQML